MGPAGCTMNLRKTHVLHTAPTLPLGEDQAPCQSRALGSQPAILTQSGAPHQRLSVLSLVP